MDPNANLAELRRIVANLLTGNDYIGLYEDTCRLAELISALDGWLSKGGFLPEAWARPETDPNMHPNVLAALAAQVCVEHASGGACPSCDSWRADGGPIEHYDGCPLRSQSHFPKKGTL